MKSSTATAVETTATVETASTTMGSTAAMAAAGPSECRRGHTKNHERKNCNQKYRCDENYRQGFLHFSPSNLTTRDCLAGTNFRRGHLRWQPTYPSILHPPALCGKSLLHGERRRGRHILPFDEQFSFGAACARQRDLEGFNQR
jgi:hypothetical protein